MQAIIDQARRALGDISSIGGIVRAADKIRKAVALGRVVNDAISQIATSGSPETLDSVVQNLRRVREDLEDLTSVSDLSEPEISRRFSQLVSQSKQLLQQMFGL